MEYKIVFDAPVTLRYMRRDVIQPVKELTWIKTVDRPGAKVVRVWIRESKRPINLWFDEDYDAAGDWTQAQAEARLREILATWVVS